MFNKISRTRTNAAPRATRTSLRVIITNSTCQLKSTVHGVPSYNYMLMPNSQIRLNRFSTFFCGLLRMILRHLLKIESQRKNGEIPEQSNKKEKTYKSSDLKFTFLNMNANSYI